LKSLALPEITIILGLLMLYLIPAIFYCIQLQDALLQCSPAARAMQPGLVWLMLLPLFNVIWHFVIVTSLSKSLRSEFTVRRIPLLEGKPGKDLGLAMCSLQAASVLPFVGLLTAIPGVICWILYWIKIAGYTRMLRQPVVMGQPV
jgi:hypothetical protein